MKIRKAMKLAYDGNPVRRPQWFPGLCVVFNRLDVILVDKNTDREERRFLNYFDLVADDWEVVE